MSKCKETSKEINAVFQNLWDKEYRKAFSEKSNSEQASKVAAQFVQDKLCLCEHKFHKGLWNKHKKSFLASKGFYLSGLAGFPQIISFPISNQLTLFDV